MPTRKQWKLTFGNLKTKKAQRGKNNGYNDIAKDSMNREGKTRTNFISNDNGTTNSTENNPDLNLESRQAKILKGLVTEIKQELEAKCGKIDKGSDEEPLGEDEYRYSQGQLDGKQDFTDKFKIHTVGTTLVKYQYTLEYNRLIGSDHDSKSITGVFKNSQNGISGFSTVKLTDEMRNFIGILNDDITQDMLNNKDNTHIMTFIPDSLAEMYTEERKAIFFPISITEGANSDRDMEIANMLGIANRIKPDKPSVKISPEAYGHIVQQLSGKHPALLNDIIESAKKDLLAKPSEVINNRPLFEFLAKNHTETFEKVSNKLKKFDRARHLRRLRRARKTYKINNLIREACEAAINLTADPENIENIGKLEKASKKLEALDINLTDTKEFQKTSDNAKKINTLINKACEAAKNLKEDPEKNIEELKEASERLKDLGITLADTKQFQGACNRLADANGKNNNGTGKGNKL